MIYLHEKRNYFPNDPIIKKGNASILNSTFSNSMINISKYSPENI